MQPIDPGNQHTAFVAAVCAISIAVSSACSREDAKAGERAPRPSAEPSALPSAAADTTARTATDCGPSCRRAPDAASAFRQVIAANPRVLGIGEAHALAGTEGIDSATRRFTRDLLPLLAGKATDLVVEVLLPNPRCQARSRAAKKEQKVVTDKQAPTDQNEFVALGNAAHGLGIRPFALEPTCADLARIAKGGAEAVTGSLEAITRLSIEKVRALLAERGDNGIIVLYGGAMHNDALPGKGKESWSYGPAVRDAAGERGYIEVDLIVPEYVKKMPAWESLPWFGSYPGAHPSRATVLTPGTHSFVIVFPSAPAMP